MKAVWDYLQNKSSLSNEKQTSERLERILAVLQDLDNSKYLDRDEAAILRGGLVRELYASANRLFKSLETAAHIREQFRLRLRLMPRLFTWFKPTNWKQLVGQITYWTYGICLTISIIAGISLSDEPGFSVFFYLGYVLIATTLAANQWTLIERKIWAYGQKPAIRFSFNRLTRGAWLAFGVTAGLGIWFIGSILDLGGVLVKQYAFPKLFILHMFTDPAALATFTFLAAVPLLISSLWLRSELRLEVIYSSEIRKETENAIAREAILSRSTSA